MLTVRQTGVKKTNLWGRGLRCSYLGAQSLVHTDDVLLEFGSRACTPFMAIDSKDDYRSGCRNVNHRQQQQSYSLGTTFIRTIILNLATYEMTPEFKPFTITFLAENDTYHTFAAVSVMRSPLLTLNGFSVVYIPNLLNGAVATSGKTPICSVKIYNPPEH